MLPWWLSFLLAGVIYLILSNISLEPVQTAQGAAPDIPNLVIGTMLITLVGLLKYVIPVGLVIGGLSSLFKQAGRRKLYGYASQGEDRSVLEAISWREFEALVGEAFRQQGYSVKETADGPDGGVDLVITKEGETYLVQCKQWKVTKVGVAKIRELYGVVTSQGAAGGIFAASGDYTQEAKAFASKNRIRLIDGNELYAMIKNAQEARPTPTIAVLDDVRCPLCNGAMLERMARRGTNAGNKFWGCSEYPKCLGTRDF